MNPWPIAMTVLFIVGFVAFSAMRRRLEKEARTLQVAFQCLANAVDRLAEKRVMPAQPIGAALDALYDAVRMAGPESVALIRVDLPSEAIEALRAENDPLFYEIGTAILERPLASVMEGATMIRNAVVIGEVKT